MPVQNWILYLKQSFDCVYTLRFIYSLIIPTERDYRFLVQFYWPKAIWEQDLYFDNSTEQESWNYFLRKNFLNELFTHMFDVNSLTATGDNNRLWQTA